MSGRETGRQPKYQRIAAELRAAVEAGRYGPGDRLPGENDLMAEHGVARMTARQALGVLQAEGIAEARKGAGVFVRDFRPIRRRGIERLARERWGAGRSIWSADIGDRELVVDSVEVTEEAAPAAVAAVLGLGEDTNVCVRRRRFVLDGKPVLLSTSYLPAALVAGTAITRPDTGPGGTYARLAELGRGPVRFREEVRSRMPGAEEAERLALPVGVPVVLVARTAFDAEGLAVEVNEMVLDSSAYVLEYDFEA
ncbi:MULTISPECIES: GntR family transcriptional regulator [Streptomyces]|uniref:GntR family transcriptional regulator n=1 Tax=Streptomyces TaxID=1883 RepID=UPI0016746A11|nr:MULTISPECIES: GntR family transcriptional regulator [Streptomyces]MBK3521822.1 GntR family transcriptional regulator [Streptomyces sp. MBT70]GGR79560.1 GntR family transcriptional regulator [Streptomyces eurythermus]